MKTRKTIILLFSLLLTMCCIPAQAAGADKAAGIEPTDADKAISIEPTGAVAAIAPADVEADEPIFTSGTYASLSGIPYTGKQCTGNKTAQASIDYILRYYKDGDKFKGRGQCWGYAEYVRTFMGGGGSPKYYKKKNTHAQVVKALKGCKPGTHVRFTSTKKGGGRSHSLVVFKFTDKEVLWADNNWGWDNRVHYYIGTPSEFQYNYKYLYFVHQPKKFKKQSKLKAAAATDADKGAVSICWPATKGTGKASIYRSTSKKSGFRKIATTGGRSYADTDTTPGKKYYYKVKRAGKTSGVFSGKRTLASPKVKFQILGNGKVRLIWNAVAGAKSYAIYSEDNGKKLATVQGTSWLVADANKSPYYAWGFYTIVAVSSNSGGSSVPTYVEAVGGPQQVNVSVRWDSWDKANYLVWNYGKNTDYYEVYRAESADGEYQKIADNLDDDCYLDTSRQSGKTYWYKVRAVQKTNELILSKTITLYSAFSNVVSY
jgi:fibronectin type 3 domain-containing protein